MKSYCVHILTATGLAVLTLAALGAASQADTPEPAAPKKLRVASYNINYGNANLKAVVEAIKKADADVVALQETNRTSERYLRKHLRKHYRHMHFEHAKRAGGFAFLSRFRLEKVRHLPRTVGWFGTYVATVKFEGRDVHLANVHL